MVHFYRKLKYGLILISIMVVCGVMYIIHDNDMAEQAGDSAELPSLELQEKAQNSASKPHFQAKDDKGQDYVIQADSAITKEGDDDVIVLLAPSYTITLNNKVQVKVTALKGFLNQEKKNLTLDGDVVVTYGNDTTFTMPNVHIDLRAGDAFGDRSIHVSNEKIRIDAGAFEIYHKGDKIVLTDRPVLTLSIKEK